MGSSAGADQVLNLPTRSLSVIHILALEWDYPFGEWSLGLPGGHLFFSGKHFNP